ncbi:MAG: DNA repair protein RadA [Candidatus Tectomicrobia bacterium]|nr:DNA repair protein RadA [Candidatus Tectomicrobia bacterium]
MAREKTHFICQSCGTIEPRWLGRCPGCGSWGSLVEERQAAGDSERRASAGEPPRAQPITAIAGGAEHRLVSGIAELDRVLGGGLVPGSVVLVGGDPGIGKSTLLLQCSGALSRAGHGVLYVAGEESAQQTRLRGERLGVLVEPLLVLAEACLEDILPTVKSAAPACLVIDSIQTVYSSKLESAPGSISQLREVAAQLITWARRFGMPIVLIGHVTKDGAIAGPKVLEHMVDTVLYFEADSGHACRILRAVKNRHGSTNEIGVFEMGAAGLIEVENPSQLFLAERAEGAPGSAVTASLEGSRPLLVELQGLVTTSGLANPRRMATGVDAARLSLIVAILEKRGGLHLHGCDIFANVAGGARLSEPAADLGIAAVLASSFLDRPIAPGTVVFGELGLAGEVRSVSQVEARLKEAAKLGFHRALVPQASSIAEQAARGLEIIRLRSVVELLGVL